MSYKMLTTEDLENYKPYQQEFCKAHTEGEGMEQCWNCSCYSEDPVEDENGNYIDSNDCCYLVCLTEEEYNEWKNYYN